MKRSYLLSAIALIGVGILFDWRLSHAIDTEKPASALEAVERSELTNLLSRIETLERRVAALEQTGPLVRQANSRTSELNDQLIPVPWTPTPSSERRQDNEDAPAQKINGQTWRYRMLGNTKPANQVNR